MSDDASVLGVVRGLLFAHDPGDRDFHRGLLADLFDDAADAGTAEMLRSDVLCLWILPATEDALNDLLADHLDDTHSAADACVRHFRTRLEMEAFLDAIVLRDGHPDNCHRVRAAAVDHLKDHLEEQAELLREDDDEEYPHRFEDEGDPEEDWEDDDYPP